VTTAWITLITVSWPRRRRRRIYLSQINIYIIYTMKCWHSAPRWRNELNWTQFVWIACPSVHAGPLHTTSEWTTLTPPTYFEGQVSPTPHFLCPCWIPATRYFACSLQRSTSRSQYATRQCQAIQDTVDRSKRKNNLAWGRRNAPTANW